MTATRSELQAWLDTWNENHAAPSANSVVDFLGIELAPEPTLPVGQRRRSPDGVEVIKTDDGTNSWRRYRGKAFLSWFTGAEVAGWEVITDAPPSANSVVDFLGIELAEPEPETPVGQRRRSPDGVEVVKTDGVSALCWQRYAGVGKAWFSYDAIADWQIVTDAPEVPENIIEAVILTLRADDHEQRERGFTNYRTNAKALARAGLLAGTLPEAPVCEREHLPSHSVRICLATISDDTIADLAEGAGNPSAPVADAAHRERERRRRVEGRA